MLLRVVTAADDQDLTDIETLKEELGITESGQDEKLERLINEASADCARFCNRVFIQETVEEIHRDVRDLKAFSLDRFPVPSITSVAVDGTALATTEYEVEAESGLLFQLSGESRVCWSGTKIVITYVGGYEFEDLPPDIGRACLEQIKALHFSAARDPLVKATDIPGVMSKQYWVGGVGDDAAVCPAAAARLESYRKPSTP